MILLSAGLDSSYNLFKARESLELVLAITFDYGQRAAIREIERAKALATQLNVPHQTIALPWLKLFTRTALVGAEQLPVGGEVEIDNLQRSMDTARSVWVPNRNGILLNIAAGFAEGLGAEFVIPGFNSEEAQTFPDNSGAFLESLTASLTFSTANHVRVQCFSTELNKTQIVADAIRLGLPFSRLWPCYLSGEQWCGECESCQRFARALEANGVSFAQLKGS